MTTHILAMGGGGFLMEDGPSPIDRYMVELPGVSRARICFISTPSGDPPEMNGAAVLFSGSEISRVVSWRSRSTAYRVTAEAGHVIEVPLICDTIA